MSLSTPAYTVIQTEQEIQITVDAVTAAPPAAAPRAILEGTTFGFVWGTAYLPLVLPANAVAKGTEPTFSMAADGLKATVMLRKARPGHIDRLEQLQPQILPDTPAAAQQAQPAASPEEQQRGSDMLNAVLGRENDRRVERGEGRIIELEAGATAKDGGEEEAAGGAGFAAQPSAPLVQDKVKTQVHEAFVADPSSDTDVEQQKRRLIAEQKEEESWDEGWYLDNYADEDAEIASLLRWQAPWTVKPIDSAAVGTTSAAPFVTSSAHLLLLEVLFSISYDIRTTLNDPSVESPWTIAVLSRSLVSSSLPSSSSSTVSSVRATLRGSYRRALTKPLYRSWTLCQAVAQDVELELLSGRSVVADLLQEAAELLQESGDEAAGAYVKSSVAPLMDWATSNDEATDVSLAQLARELQTARKSLTRQDVGGASWDLDALEQAAAEVMAEGMDSD